MKKRLFSFSLIALLAFSLSACSPIVEQTGSFSVIYAAALFFSLLILLIHCLSDRRKEVWYTVLFSSISVVILGYLLLSVSTSLTAALWFNRLSYLGSVFLPFSLMMIILQVTKSRYSALVPHLLGALSAAVFFVAASPGVLDIYYKKVTLVTANSGSYLEKVYGPWHKIYLFFLLGYFIAMLIIIGYSLIRRTAFTRAYSLLLLGAAAVNICVWALGSHTETNFEFLAVSYIITELFLLGLSALIDENEKRIAAINSPSPVQLTKKAAPLTECHRFFASSLPKLTTKEREVYRLYLKGSSTREVLTALNINENTLKYHNKNIYSKLGVSSRKQLLEFAADIKASGEYDEADLSV